MSDAHDEDVKKHVRVYVNVFLALLILTVVTVGVYYVHLPVALAIAVALLIAIFKGSLVASFFMHLSAEKQIIYAALVLTAVLFAALMFLPLLTFADHTGTRLQADVSESVPRPVH